MSTPSDVDSPVEGDAIPLSATTDVGSPVEGDAIPLSALADVGSPVEAEAIPLSALADVGSPVEAEAIPLSALADVGSPVEGDAIPLCVPEIRGREWDYVKECLDTNWVSSGGRFVNRFESDFAQWVGAKYAVASVNGTAALHIALLLAGVEPDDEVLVSSLTFIAPVNAIRYAQAWPILVDAEPDYWQMDPARVEAFLRKECKVVDGQSRNTHTNRRVKAIVPVHILGHSVDMDPLLDLATKYNLRVIEDATESLGATYRDRKIGRMGDVACFSFNGNKLITTGGGGMIVTDEVALASRAKYLTTQAKDDPTEYVHGQIGYNYRLTNIQAAIGCAQLEQLDEYIAIKRRIAATYDAELSSVPGLALMREAPWCRSAYWMSAITVDKSRYGMDSRMLLRRLSEVGIQTRPLWQPIHLSPAYRGSQHIGGEVSEMLNARALCLPCSVGLTKAQQDRVIASIRSFAS